MDGVAWWATVHGVAKGRTQLRDFTFAFSLPQTLSPFPILNKLSIRRVDSTKIKHAMKQVRQSSCVSQILN